MRVVSHSTKRAEKIACYTRGGCVEWDLLQISQLKNNRYIIIKNTDACFSQSRFTIRLSVFAADQEDDNNVSVHPHHPIFTFHLKQRDVFAVLDLSRISPSVVLGTINDSRPWNVCLCFVLMHKCEIC